MAGKPRILFLVPGLSVGGAERHTLDLREQLGRRGYPTTLVVHGRRHSEVLAAHPGAADAVFLRLRGMSDPRGWRRVRIEMKRAAPDIVISVNQMPLIVAVASRMAGARPSRIVNIFHTTVLRSSEKRLFFLFRYALKLADALVFVSDNQRAYWSAQHLTSKRVRVILNGIDQEHFRPAADARAKTRSLLGLADDDYVIGVVAAFRPEKNHLAIVTALTRLKARGVSAKALLVGDGPTREDVEREARAHEVIDQVIFAGEQADVRPFIAACDVGLLCSVAVETFSLSALEFLAMGVPMVMSRVGGASEIVCDGVNGSLFAAGSVDEMVERLQAAADPHTRAAMAAAARSSIAGLSLERMVDAYADLAEELAASAKAGAR